MDISIGDDLLVLDGRREELAEVDAAVTIEVDPLEHILPVHVKAELTGNFLFHHFQLIECEHTVSVPVEEIKCLRQLLFVALVSHHLDEKADDAFLELVGARKS